MITRNKISTAPLVIQELPEALGTNEATIAAKADRVGDIQKHTVLGQNPTTGKWEPWAKNLTGGTPFNVGVLTSETIPEAKIKAGDVADQSVLQFGARVNDSLLVVEGADTIDSVVGTGTSTTTLRNLLHRCSIFPQKAYVEAGTYS